MHLSKPARDAFLRQAKACFDMGSHFTGTLCEAIAETGLPEGLVHDRLSNWPGIADTSGDAVPLRLAGALHRLVLDGADEDLARIYPPHWPEHSSQASNLAKTLMDQVQRAVLRHEAFISDYLNSPPQTNEVARSALLLPAFMWLAARHPADFEILELGASAGLNQNLARYCADYGIWQAGDQSSPVRIQCQWRSGGRPEQAGAPFSVLAHSGCDLEPVKIDSENQRKRLRSYVWADQTARLARLEAALELARHHPPEVARAGAADWLAEKLQTPHQAPHRVIMHTIMWQYMPDSEKARAEALIRRHARRANASSPISWLRFETDGQSPGAGIYATTWSGGAQDGITHCLGRGDYHGRWIAWQG